MVEFNYKQKDKSFTTNWSSFSLAQDHWPLGKAYTSIKQDLNYHH